MFACGESDKLIYFYSSGQKIDRLCRHQWLVTLEGKLANSHGYAYKILAESTGNLLQAVHRIYICSHAISYFPREKIESSVFINKKQRTNGPVNAHLVSGPSISTKHTKPGYKWPSEF